MRFNVEMSCSSEAKRLAWDCVRSMNCVRICSVMSGCSRMVSVYPRMLATGVLSSWAMFWVSSRRILFSLSACSRLMRASMLLA